SRKEISELSIKPIVFFGGDIMENNTVNLIPSGRRDYQVKSPDFGNGFGELEISSGASRGTPEKKQVNIGGMPHSFKSVLLKSGKLTYNACSRILENSLPFKFVPEAQNRNNDSQ
ncbi:MAG: hypothetical protein ACKOA8_13370, partial [Deltaproteobacteria bacterium]